MQRALMFLVAAGALAAGLYLSASFNRPTPEAKYLSANSDLVGSFRPDFRLGSSTGEFVTPADFAGKTLLINFWATPQACKSSESRWMMFKVCGISLKSSVSATRFLLVPPMLWKPIVPTAT